MTDVLDRIKGYLTSGGMFNPELANHDSVRELVINSRDEIIRLKKYEKLVQFIANDYHELSHDKAKWQRDDWKKRCKKLIEVYPDLSEWDNWDPHEGLTDEDDKFYEW